MWTHYDVWNEMADDAKAAGDVTMERVYRDEATRSYIQAAIMAFQSPLPF